MSEKTPQTPPNPKRGPEPIEVPFDKISSLHITQKNGKPGGGGLSFLKNLTGALRKKSIHIQHVPVGEQGRIEFLSEGVTNLQVSDTTYNEHQEMVITTCNDAIFGIVLKWPKGVGLEKFRIDADDFNVRFETELPSKPDVKAQNGRLALGDVDFVPARETKVVTSSTGISGLVPMHAILDLSSNSGSIAITLLPLHDKERQDSTLLLKTGSGSISLNHGAKFGAQESLMHLPDGHCILTMEAGSGSISATTGLPHTGSVTTGSGSQWLQVLLPHASEDGKRQFKTRSGSGSQSIVFKDSGVAAKVDIAAAHTANSGGIGITYPASWEGVVEAQAGSGHITIQGDGVEVEKEGKIVKGVKGHGTHHTDIKTTSGSTKVKFVHE